MATLDRQTGKLISGFDEVLQSLSIRLTTRRGTRIMRRHYGAELHKLVDRSLSPLTLIDYFAAIAEASRDEPRFRLVRSHLSEESDIPAGRPIFDIEGLYYPRGHLGDFSEVRDARGRIVLADPLRR